LGATPQGLLGALQPCCLGKGSKNKLGAVDEVSAAETPGLLKQPEKPFQAVLARPSRGLPNPSGEDIEGGAYSHHH